MKKISRDGRGRFTSNGQTLARLKRDDVVRDWLMSLSSMRTREKYLWGLNQVLKVAGASPSELLRVSVLEAKMLVKKAMGLQVDSVKRQVYYGALSFFGYYEKDVSLKRHEKPRVRRVKVGIEVIPDVSDVYMMADTTKGFRSLSQYRNPAVILVLFQSGMRLTPLTRLTYGHVKKYLYPEITLPVYLKITSEEDTKLSGYGVDYYYTFLNKEAAEALKRWLDYRKSKGWIPKDSDPVFVERDGNPLSLKMVWEIVKAAARKSGLKSEGIWARCLRKSFRKVLNRTVIDEDTKEALMGHKLPGSRGNYFDYHDVDEVANKYMTANFGRNSVSQMNGRFRKLEAEVKELREENLLLREEQRQQKRRRKPRESEIYVLIEQALTTERGRELLERILRR